MIEGYEAEPARVPAVPLLIGVTGHRDLRPEEIPALRIAVRRWLEELRDRCVDSPLEVATCLSPGADLLVAEEAFALGLDGIAVLPLPLDLCRADYRDPADRERFETALARCRRVIHGSESAASAGGPLADGTRTAHYAAASELIAANSFLLLALWDGRQPEPPQPGGTAATVEYRLRQLAWGNDDRRSSHQELLPNLPPELVYHIVVSRAGSEPEAGLLPLQAGYLSMLNRTLESALPDSALLVAARTGELNRDLKQHAAAIAAAPARNPIGDLAEPPAGIVEAAHLFHAVDALATKLRGQVLNAIRLTAGLTIAMAFCLLIYSHVFAEHGADRPRLDAPGSSLAALATRLTLPAYLVGLVALVAINWKVRASSLQRRQLEIRALAEGLRVELFWAIAGVGGPRSTVASHRRILKQADPGLEWIPNAIRATSFPLASLRQVGIPGGIDYAVRRWIGTDHRSGLGAEQLYYFWYNGEQKARHTRWVEVMTPIFIVVTGLLGLVLALGRVSSDDWRTFLLCLVGALPLIAGVLEDVIQKTADRELRRQYRYMFDVFRSARDRLLQAKDDTERREVLYLLGNAALAEHAQWLFLHRDRPIDRTRLQ